jgi:riboflavin synthase
MFTGIVQGLRPVVEVVVEENLRRLGVDLGDLDHNLAPGASVAINGVCLTVTAVSNGAAFFDVIHETLARTNLGDLAPGAHVNVERSLHFGDEIGGHLVSGHVAGVGRIVAVDAAPNRRDVTIEVDAALMPYLHHKGFVAVDGASLTVAHLDAGAARFTVTLIPETVVRTTLGTVTLGDRVNIEIDAQTQTIVDTVTRVLVERGVNRP